MPRIEAEGKFDDAVLLHNVQQIELRHLEITNQGEKPAEIRRGVHIFLENWGIAKHIIVSGLYVHHVNSTNQRKNTGGIVFTTQGGTTPSRFDGLTIERNIVWKTDRSAIVAQSSHSQRRRWNPSTNVVIRDNYVVDIGGDGIVPWATDGVVIEHNIAHRCNQRGENYNAAIWPWSTDNTLVQLNEASLTRATRDGEGFDSDYNSRNSMFQYNYSHDNEGGFMLICGPGKRDTSNNIGNRGTVVRYNISHNDHTRLFNISGDVTKTLVHDNAFYVTPGFNVDVLISNWSGWPVDLVFKNNTFYAEGNIRYGHQTSSDGQEGLSEIGTGWGPAKEVVFEGNRFYGNNLDKPDDAKAVVTKTVKPIILDWDIPVFNPSSPEGFDEFMMRHRTWMIGLMEKEFGKPVKLGR
jgi:hypothetical protein